jgi:Family of unknown function (DUF6496)
MRLPSNGRAFELRRVSSRKGPMPEKETIERAKKDKAEGKAPSTQAGEFVREEMDHIREGKHGARSPQQAIAIGLSKARRAGVDLPPPRKGTTSEATRKSAERDLAKGQSGRQAKPSAKRSQAELKALKRESRSAASKPALSTHAKEAAARRKKRGKVTATSDSYSR